MPLFNYLRLSFRRLWLIVSVIGLLCILTYSLYVSLGRQNAIDTTADHLKLESSLQADEIRNDLTERMTDLRLISESMEIRRFFETSSGELAVTAQAQSVSDWLEIFLEHDDAHIASVYDSRGHLLLRIHPHGEAQHAHYLNAEHIPVVLAMEDVRPVNVDLVADVIYFNLVVPVRGKEAKASAMGYLRLDFSVEQSIFKWLKHPLNRNFNHEALLAKPIGKEFYFFSPFREEGSVFARSAEQVQAEPAKQALAGKNGLSIGLDYDGVPVFAWVEYIEELDASLVVKLDQEAAMASLRQAALVVASFFGGGCLLLVLFFSLASIRRERHYSSQLVAAEQAKAAATEQALLLKKAADYATNLVYITDAEGLLIYANPAVLKVSGYQMEELIGRNPSIFKSGVHPPKMYQDMWQTLKTGKPFFCEVTNRRKDGSFWHQEGVITPILDDDDRITHYVAIHKDISDSDELRDHLYRALDEAVEASHVKSEFIARISHELRTPMNGIMGMIQLLEMTDLTSEQAELLETADDCSNSMMEIVDELLELTVGNRSVLHNQVIELQPTLQLWIERWQHAAQGKHLTLDLVCPDDLPVCILADKDILHKILAKLVANSIKFSDAGKILVWVTYFPESGSLGILRVLIEDEGCGIPEDYKSHVFEPFSQAEHAFTRSQGGLGLGLYLAKKMADSIGARLSYENRESGGSIFGFELRVDTVDAKEPALDTSVDISECRVLVAEDDVSNQLIIQKMLEKLDVSTVLVNNGEEVLAAMAKESFDLLLLDCHMPIMDGFEAAKTIRSGKLKLHNPDLSIIALTADADEECRLKCTSSGMNEFLEKPVTLQQVEAAILRAYASQGSPIIAGQFGAVAGSESA